MNLTSKKDLTLKGCKSCRKIQEILNNPKILLILIEMNEAEEPTFIKTPIWYLKIRSKISKRRDRQLLGLLIPGVITYIIVYFFWLLLINFNISVYVVYSTIVIFILVYIILYYFTWKIFITRNAKYDRADLFSFLCGSIGIELSELSVIPTYNHYLGPNTSSLKTNIWFTKRRYKHNEHLKNSLEEFSKNLDNIIIWLKKPQDHSKDFFNLSDKFLDLGQYVSNHYETRIDVNFVERITKELKEIQGRRTTIETLYEFAKKNITTKRIIILILDFIFSAGTYFALVGELGKGVTLGIAAVVFFGFPTLLKELR